MASATKAGKIAADAGANLAKGTAEVAKAKAASIKESAMERIGDTTGGKIAAAIKGMGNTEQPAGPTFADNSLSGEREADPESEVAAFVNRDHSSHNMTPGYQAEFAPDEAERAGAFIEDALAEQDAAESGDEVGASASVGPTDTSTHLMER